MSIFFHIKLQYSPNNYISYLHELSNYYMDLPSFHTLPPPTQCGYLLFFRARLLHPPSGTALSSKGHEKKGELKDTCGGRVWNDAGLELRIRRILSLREKTDKA